MMTDTGSCLLFPFPKPSDRNLAIQTLNFLVDWIKCHDFFFVCICLIYEDQSWIQQRLGCIGKIEIDPGTIPQRERAVRIFTRSLFEGR